MKTPNTNLQTPRGNTKLQSPNTKQTSNSKPQPTPLVNGWGRNIKHQSPNTNTQLVDGWHSFNSEPLVLKDEPATENQPVRHPFDLEERTALFGERVVRFAKTIPRNPVNNRIIDQLVGAGTSVGGNFCEANDCESKRDFRHILKRCIKEAKETRHFLRMTAAAEPSLAPEARDLYREATELLKIFSSMHRK